MSDTFPKLCSEILRATDFMSNYEECCARYRPILDYILAHSSEREDIAKTLSQFVTDGGYNKIALVQFLMTSLRWPEIRTVAEARLAQEGNMYLEVKQVIDVYGPVT